jgi:hypothetical protein
MFKYQRGGVAKQIGIAFQDLIAFFAYYVSLYSRLFRGIEAHWTVH